MLEKPSKKPNNKIIPTATTRCSVLIGSASTLHHLQIVNHCAGRKQFLHFIRSESIFVREAGLEPATLAYETNEIPVSPLPCRPGDKFQSEKFNKTFVKFPPDFFSCEIAIFSIAHILPVDK